jgi:hypothetical protein
MDVENLHRDIQAGYASDPITSAQLPTPTIPKWKLSNGLLLLNDRIYVPDVLDLRLGMLRHKHNHSLSGHFGQNKAMELICREYVWPNMRSFVKDYVNSCNTCKQLKTPHHKPYGLLKQLPIPIRPWSSISMDFIEHLPSSNGFTSILVIVERLTK